MRAPFETGRMRRRAVTLLGALASLAVAACTEPVAPGAAEIPVEADSAAAAGASADYLPTPAGLYHRSCVHQVPAGSIVGRDLVVRRRDGSRYQLPACAYPARSSIVGTMRDPGAARLNTSAGAPPTINGWVHNTWATSPGFPYKRIVADWRVPNNPQTSYSNQGRVYYTFPGLQSSSYIIQPVLQYGNSGYYGGAYWTIASWHCGGPNNSNCTHSAPITVSAGNLIHGEVNATSCSAGWCTWSITTTNSSTGQSTTHTVQDTEDYWQATSGAVEVYGLNVCQEFPAHGDYQQSGVFYTNVSVQDYNRSPVTPAWSPVTRAGLSPDCDFRVTYTATTANLHHAPPATGYITGPMDISRYQSAQYTATPLYGTAPWQYEWRVRHSPDGSSWGAWSSWTAPSSQATNYTSVTSCGIRRVNLQARVTDTSGRQGVTSDYYVGVINPC